MRLLILTIFLGWCFRAEAAQTNWPSAARTVELRGGRLTARRAEAAPRFAPTKGVEPLNANSRPPAREVVAQPEPTAREFPLMFQPPPRKPTSKKETRK